MESGAIRSDELAGRLLAGCDPQQREAITTEARPLCVLAAAGSAKRGCSRVASLAGERRHRLGTVRASAHVHPQAASELRGPARKPRARRTGDCRNLPTPLHSESSGDWLPSAAVRRPSSSPPKPVFWHRRGPGLRPRPRHASLNSPPRSNGRRRQCLTAREYRGLPASRATSQCDRPSSRRSGSATTGEATSRRPRLR